jgi:spore maturation protein CgeB
MKILVSGNIYPDSFAKNIVVTLQEMGQFVRTTGPALSGGHSVLPRKLLDYAKRAFIRLEESSYNPVIREAADFGPDLILFPGDQPHPRVIRKLRLECTAKIVQWFPDAISNLDRQYILASDYDVIFFKDEYIAEFVHEKLGKNACFLPQACNPIWHRRTVLTPADRQKYGCDITVAGNLYWYRALMLEPFVDYDLKIWGESVPRWLESQIIRMHQNSYVAEHEKAKAYSAARIVLNSMHYAELLGSNLRLFEAAGCGAFQIVDWRPNLHKFFEPDKEIVTFRTRQELKEKVDYYLHNDVERQSIADCGYERAHREHTYEHRLKHLIDQTLYGHVDTI